MLRHLLGITSHQSNLCQHSAQTGRPPGYICKRRCAEIRRQQSALAAAPQSPMCRGSLPKGGHEVNRTESGGMHRLHLRSHNYLMCISHASVKMQHQRPGPARLAHRVAHAGACVGGTPPPGSVHRRSPAQSTYTCSLRPTHPRRMCHVLHGPNPGPKGTWANCYAAKTHDRARQGLHSPAAPPLLPLPTSSLFRLSSSVTYVIRQPASSSLAPGACGCQRGPCLSSHLATGPPGHSSKCRADSRCLAARLACLTALGANTASPP